MLLQAVADLLHCILTAEPASTFHKISMHAAMTPSDIGEKLRLAFQQAAVLKASHEFYDSKPGKTNQTSKFVSPVLRNVAKDSSKSLHYRMKYPLYSAHAVRKTSPSSSSSDTSEDPDDFTTLSPELHPSDTHLVPDLPRPCSIILPAVSSKKPPGPRSSYPTPALRMPFVTVYKCSNSIII